MRISKLLTSESFLDIIKTGDYILKYGTRLSILPQLSLSTTRLELKQQNADAENFYFFMTLLTSKNKRQQHIDSVCFPSYHCLFRVSNWKNFFFRQKSKWKKSKKYSFQLFNHYHIGRFIKKRQKYEMNVSFYPREFEKGFINLKSKDS